MRSSRKQVYSSVAAVLGLSSMAANASLNMDYTATTPTPTTYAQEINIENSATITSPAAGAADFGVVVQSGWGVSNGAHVYYRFDLANAKFATAPSISVIPYIVTSPTNTLLNCASGSTFSSVGATATTFTSGALAGVSGTSGISASANPSVTTAGAGVIPTSAGAASAYCTVTGGTPTATIVALSSNASNTTISQGGMGSSAVLFDATANTNGINVNDYVYLNLGGAALIPTGKGPITLTYRAYTSSDSASVGGPNPVKTKTVTIANFTPALAFGVNSSPATISIAAQNNFGLFDTTSTGITGNNQLANLGGFWLGAVSGVLNATGSPVSASTTNGPISGANAVLVPSASYLLVTGNFSTAAGSISSGTSGTTTSSAGLYISTDSACATASLLGPYEFTPVGSASGGITAAKISLSGMPVGGFGTVASSPTANAYLCYQDTAGTAQAIPEGDYKLQLVTTASTGHVAQSYSAGQMATFKRAGTTLQASFVAGTSVTSGGGVNRFVFTNTGSTPATIITGTVLSNDGTSSSSTSGTALSIPTSANTVPANGVLALEVANIMPTTITKRSSVVFTLGAAPDSIKGTYQLLMPGAATQTVVQMVPASQSK